MLQTVTTKYENYSNDEHHYDSLIKRIKPESRVTLQVGRIKWPLRQTRLETRIDDTWS